MRKGRQREENEKLREKERESERESERREQKRKINSRETNKKLICHS